MYRDGKVYESGNDEWLENVNFIGINSFHFMGITSKNDIEKSGLEFADSKTEKEFENNLLEVNDNVKSK